MKHSSPFAVLKHRDFRLLWIGLLISSIGTQMQIVAVIWHVYELTHSPYFLGLIGLSRFLPLLLFSPFAGIIADMVNRKKLMFIAQIIMTILALVLLITTATHTISPLLIFITLGLNSIASALDTPARQSLVPVIVPKKDLIKAIGLNTLMWQASIVIGPSIGGFLIAYFGVASIYFLNALSFMGVVVALILMGPIKQIISTSTSFSITSLREGFSFIKKSPLIWSTMVLDFFATFFSSATVLLPVFAKDILKVGPTGLGFLYAAPAFGAVFAGVIFSSFHEVKKQGKILLVSIIVYGVATVLFGLSRSFYLSLIFLGLTGVGDMISTIIRNTIRQINTPDYIRGRIIGINMIFFQGGPQLGEVEAGVAAGIMGTPLSVVFGGIGTLFITGIIAFLVPKLRRYQAH